VIYKKLVKHIYVASTDPLNCGNVLKVDKARIIGSSPILQKPEYNIIVRARHEDVWGSSTIFDLGTKWR
jgi:hypothetical protein